METGEIFEPVKDNVMLMLFRLEVYDAAVHVWSKADDAVGKIVPQLLPLQPGPYQGLPLG